MGFFARFLNVFKGFFSVWVEDLEKDNPEIVYQQAINERVTQHQKLLGAVASIVTLRNKLSRDLQAQRKALEEVTAQIPVAVQQGEEEAALLLIERKNQLTAELAETERELKEVTQQADEAKAGLVSFQGEIEKLKAERDRMLAKREHARARLKIQEQLSGLSTAAETRALAAVRESIHKLEAQADVASEVQGAGVDHKLRQIKAATTTSVARSELEALKRQMAAQQQAGAEKTL
ncbi:MAG: PspA/IM30 family protein [Candidatus Sericytochromatia bacterium]|nr:PspA/IM30 family protein [Candidatus Sericytochromatia bacterium]